MRGTADGAIETLDGRETAPAGADAAVVPRRRRQAAAVHAGGDLGPQRRRARQCPRSPPRRTQRYGKLPWAALFEPAIALARDGFVLSARGREFLVQRQEPRRASSAEALRALLRRDGRAAAGRHAAAQPGAGGDARARSPATGPKRSTAAPTPRAIAAEVAAETPRAGADDRRPTSPPTTAKERAPVCGDYRGYRICGMGPPSSGATTVYAILGSSSASTSARWAQDSPTFWHLFAESQRLAYRRPRALRWPTPTSSRCRSPALIDPAYLAAAQRADRPGAHAGLGRRRHARGRSRSPRPTATSPRSTAPRTSSPSTATGNAVSYTSTDRGLVRLGADGRRLLPQQRADRLQLRARRADGRPVANRVEGGKRPRSSMAPTLVYDPQGRSVMAVGAAGGATIPVQVARALIGVIDFGLPLERGDRAAGAVRARRRAARSSRAAALEAMIPQLAGARPRAGRPRAGCRSRPTARSAPPPAGSARPTRAAKASPSPSERALLALPRLRYLSARR